MPVSKEKRQEYARRYYQAHKAEAKQALKDRRHNRAEWFFNLKKKLKCKCCEENHPACLDFHHKEGFEKDEIVSELVCEGYSEEKILAEIEKCEVICSNCHRKLHSHNRKFTI